MRASLFLLVILYSGLVVAEDHQAKPKTASRSRLESAMKQTPRDLPQVRTFGFNYLPGDIERDKRAEPNVQVESLLKILEQEYGWNRHEDALNELFAALDEFSNDSVPAGLNAEDILNRLLKVATTSKQSGTRTKIFQALLFKFARLQNDYHFDQSKIVETALAQLLAPDIDEDQREQILRLFHDGLKNAAKPLEAVDNSKWLKRHLSVEHGMRYYWSNPDSASLKKVVKILAARKTDDTYWDSRDIKKMANEMLALLPGE